MARTRAFYTRQKNLIPHQRSLPESRASRTDLRVQDVPRRAVIVFVKPTTTRRCHASQLPHCIAGHIVDSVCTTSRQVYCVSRETDTGNLTRCIIGVIPKRGCQRLCRTPRVCPVDAFREKVARSIEVRNGRHVPTVLDRPTGRGWRGRRAALRPRPAAGRRADRGVAGRRLTYPICCS